MTGAAGLVSREGPAMTMTGTRDNGLEVYAMIPKSVVLGECHDGCVDVFAILDLIQGSGTRPFRGVRSLMGELGWGQRRVYRHLEHLQSRGLVEPVQDGQHKQVFRVRNPARGVSTARTAVYPPRVHPGGDCVSTARTPPRSIRSDIGSSSSSSSDFEQVSADDDVVEIRDFDVNDLVAEIAAFEAADAGLDHLEEPAEVDATERVLELLRRVFGDDVEEVAS
jgi:hypothetical protein